MNTKRGRVRNMQALLENKNNIIVLSFKAKKRKKDSLNPSRFYTMTDEQQKECMESMYQDEDR